MRLPLREVARDDATITLATTLPPSGTSLALRYGTVVGALLQIEGATAGAFDHEHREVVLGACERPRDLRLEVERRSLPTHGLPSGPGLSWWWMNLRSAPQPATSINVAPWHPEPRERSDARVEGPTQPLALWGHSHLDVAWLWTCEQSRRKAQRTFAIAADLLERNPTFCFIQSQPQLYAFVQERDPQLFARVRALAQAGRFDAEVAALWVEPDCNLPSGESLLRQMLEAHRYCADHLGVAPKIAWLPDSFGFANTLPMLLAHCGIERFATTKLQWNDTTRFPFAQFVWRAPDGSEVLGALIDRYDGNVTVARERTARLRGEPLVAGYGDGGGGVTTQMLAAARGRGTWQPAQRWFGELERRRASLPVHADELYLQYHRGVYSTHHDLKAHNAALERCLSEVEELLAWCCAVRLPKSALDQLRGRLNEAWRIVLRNQFHDVLPGTSIPEAAADARGEYAQAHALVERVAEAARGMLPRAPRHGVARACSAPARVGRDYVFDNGLVRARFLDDGTLREVAAKGERNAVVAANRLMLYEDRPLRWEAWNLDDGYERTQRPARPGAANMVEGALEIPFDLGNSPARMRVALLEGEPFVRVDLVVDWRERRTLLRVENQVSAGCAQASFGTPHGIVKRSTRRDTPEQRAMFEVPGQRLAFVRDAAGDGIALFALDTYGWSARTFPDGSTSLGHSLLRGTTWPDPRADLGEAQLSWAFAPFACTVSTGDLEHAWRQFAHEPSVRLFTSGDRGVLVTSCKPAEDGDGIIVRVRECNGSDATLALRCGGRMREAIAVDGLERPLGANDVRIEGESLVAPLPGFGLRSFRIRF